MIIIADSGSTKVDFRVIDDNGKVRKAACSGMNPVYVSQAAMQEALKAQLLPVCGGKVDAIYFYGAGVIGEAADRVRGAFSEVIDYDLIYVESDMLGAARALFGDREGIACILGTGSNSCYYDGHRIVRNVRSGGFILGDEAGGADLGKRLLKAVVKGLLPAQLQTEFEERCVPRAGARQVPGLFLALPGGTSRPSLHKRPRDRSLQRLHPNERHAV